MKKSAYVHIEQANGDHPNYMAEESLRKCTYRVHTIKQNGLLTPFNFADYKLNLVILIDVILLRLSTKYEMY